MSNIKELSVVEAFIMDGRINEPGHEDEVLISLGDRFFDCTACTDTELKEIILNPQLLAAAGQGEPHHD